jgi:hypothetical protein
MRKVPAILPAHTLARCEAQVGLTHQRGLVEKRSTSMLPQALMRQRTQVIAAPAKQCIEIAGGMSPAP